MARSARNIALSLLFCCLTESALAASPAPDSDTNTHLRVRTIAGYLLVVSVSINDHGPFDFLIDTGTNTTLIDPQLPTELGLAPKDKLKLASLASSTDVPRYYLQTFRVGPASISHYEALAVPLPQLTAFDHKIRGILGMNFLLQFSFRLDYEHSTLTFILSRKLRKHRRDCAFRSKSTSHDCWSKLIPMRLPAEAGSSLLIPASRSSWSFKTASLGLRSTHA